VRKTYEELLAIEPLSKCLQKASCAVEASGPQELRDWLRLELAGYYASNKALTEDTRVQSRSWATRRSIRQGASGAIREFVHQ
jgi:hypothetical protein